MADLSLSHLNVSSVPIVKVQQPAGFFGASGQQPFVKSFFLDNVCHQQGESKQDIKQVAGCQ
jgi:hypothetical protein